MDRNDKIKQKYYDREKKVIKPKVNYDSVFNPEPYVDVIFNRMENEVGNGEDEAADFLSNMKDNPNLNIIFGKSSVLTIAQKAAVMQHLMYRITVAKEFDPTPYVNTLVDLFDKGDFDQFKKYDEMGDFSYNFRDYFKSEKLTKEQLILIEERFYSTQSEKANTYKSKLITPFIISVIIVLVPPFFIPNFLQKMGLLSVDAGWFVKICVGILSLIIIFFVIKKVFSWYITKTLSSRGTAYLDVE